MNQKQREFLIEKIKKAQKERVSELKKTIPEPPSVEQFIHAEALTGQLKLKPIGSILNDLVNRIETSKKNNWIDSDGWGDDAEYYLKLSIEAVIDLPKRYIQLMNEYKHRKAVVTKEIQEINGEMETLLTRIQLASNKVLDHLTGEIDDLGNISLIDNTLKKIIAPTANPSKQITE